MNPDKRKVKFYDLSSMIIVLLFLCALMNENHDKVPQNFKTKLQIVKEYNDILYNFVP